MRRFWVSLTPEEWVRQNFLQYLMQVKNYARTLISVEKIIMLGELKKRYDIVVYKNSLPWMIVECKEMNVDINIKTLEQTLRYNMVVGIQFLVMTNGNTTMAYEIVDNAFKEINDLPLM